MRRILLAALLAVLVLPATASAVTITEFGLPAYHSPRDIIAHPGGYLAYSYGGTAPSGGVGRISTAGALMPDFPVRSGGSTAPFDLIATPNGVVYSVGMDGLTLRTDSSAIALTTSASATASSFDALVDDGTGAIVYSATISGNAEVCKTTCTTSFGTSTITALGRAPDGHVWALQANSARLLRFTTGSDAPVVDQIISLPSGPSGSYYRLAIGPDGNVWVPGPGDAIQRVTQTGQRDSFALPAGTRPSGVTAGPGGALWISGPGNATVVRMTTAGQVTTVVPIPSGRPPGAITAGPDGAIWFVESLYAQIGRLIPDPVAPGGGTPGGGTPGGGTTGAPVRDTVRPLFVRTPSFARKRVRAGRDAKLRAQLSEAARLKVTLGKRTTGRRVNGACVKTTRRNRGRARCTRYPTAKTLTKAGVAGDNTITVPTRRLHAGAYRATITATDAAGNAGAPASARLTITRR